MSLKARQRRGCGRHQPFESSICFSAFELAALILGVIALHGGMIYKNGIAAFSSPEQELSFLSLESAKLIVLSKTFGLAKAVTALGVTSTRAGISSK
jgi:hypothetical protein